MEIVVAIAAKIAEYTVVPIGHQFGYLIHYNSNIASLGDQVDKLKGVQTGVQGLVDAAERNGQVIRPDVQTWLMKVKTMTESSDSFFRDEVNPNQRCSSFPSCPNLLLRHKVSRKAKKKKLDVDELLGDSKFDGVSFPPPPPPIFVGDLVEVYKSRESTLNEIIEALKDDKTNIIGVYGMGGIGKTTLVKNVAKEYKQLLFDESAMAVVSQTPNIKKIQDEIASSLGLKLDEKDSLPIRAGHLRERINKSKRILVILDDLWNGLDLEEIGLPQVDVHKGCKILLTTRIYQMCVQMQSQSNFPIEILSESEAWDLFRKIAGDVVDSVDLKPIATEVAHECAGLPLSIVTVARTLMKVKDRSVWRDAARRLQNPSATNITEMHTKVYSSLKLSYDFLDDQDAKYCFLLCCLADEDSDIRIESLVGFGMGLGIFASRCKLLEIKDRVKASVKKLKDRSLLLHCKDESCVRMHDVVRDFATSVVSEVQHGSWARMDIGSKIPSAFDNDEFDCSNLKMLLLKSPDDSLDNLFERMKDLRVLSIICLMFSMNGKLPSSVQYLVNLRTLCLEDCYVELDLSFIGKLKSLEVLSFFRCGIRELPREIEQLKRLRVLELRKCYYLNVIPAGVISSLSQLEGLYMRENSFTDWGKNGNASLVELNDLTKLSTIEFHLPGDVKLFPNDLDFVSLSEFQISLGTQFYPYEWESLYKVGSFSKALKLGNCHQSIASCDGVKMLVNNAESLISKDLEEEEDLEYFLSELEIEGFSRLKYLAADNTILNEEMPQQHRICLFPVLEELELRKMQNLRGICCSRLRSGSFCELRNLILFDLPNLENLWVGNASLPNLRVVKIRYCDSMKNLFSVSLNKASDFCQQLSVLQVSRCQNLEEIFAYDIKNGEALATEHDEIVVSEFRILELIGVPAALTTFCSKRSNHISDLIQKALFSEKIAFPNLEQLIVGGRFQEIWPQKIPGSSFCRLRVLNIHDFHKIKTAIPSNMVHQLQNLERLAVFRCAGVEEVVEEVPRKLNKISVDDCGSLRCLFTASQARDLKEIYIEDCRMMKEIVDSSKETGNCTLELPLLEKLTIRGCPKLGLFFGGSGCAEGNESQKALLPPNNNVKRRMKKFSELFGGGSGCAQGKASQKASSSNNNATANVRESFNCEEEDDVVIQSLFNEKVLLPNLRKLEVAYCASLRNLFTPSVIKALACLEELRIRNCSFLEQVVVKEEEERIQISDQDRVIVFPKLRTMKLTDLPKLGSFYPGNLILKFPSLEEVSLSGYPHMQIFYSGPAVAPVNTQVSFVAPIDTYTPENPTPITHYSPEGDLDSVVRYLFNKKVLLPNLRKLEVTKCNSLRNLFTPSVIKALACLEELRIRNCSFLEQVVVKEEEEIIHVSDQDKVMVFPKLRIMELIDLPKFGSFYPGNLTLKFPSLEGVFLSDCPHMQTFSSSPVFAPVNTKVSFAAQTFYGDELVSPTLITEYSPEGDLNSVVRYLFNKKVLMPNLRKLEVTYCDSLRNLFTPSVIKALACLEELRIRNCSFLEQVVEKEEEEIIHVSDQDKVMVFPKLRIMELIDLPKFGSFYPGNLTLKFPSLEGVSLSDCPHMQTFSSSPVFAPVNTKVSFAARTFYGDELVLPTLITEYSPEGDLNSVVRYLFNKKTEEDERKEKDKEDIASSRNLNKNV